MSASTDHSETYLSLLAAERRRVHLLSRLEALNHYLRENELHIEELKKKLPEDFVPPASLVLKAPRIMTTQHRLAISEGKRKDWALRRKSKAEQKPAGASVVDQLAMIDRVGRERKKSSRA